MTLPILQLRTRAAVTIECITDLPATDITVVTDEADNCGTPVVAFVSDASTVRHARGDYTYLLSDGLL